MKQRFEVEGHRGHKPLENSMEGFLKAIEFGCNGIETDLWMTKDKQIVIAHGESQFGFLRLKHKYTEERKNIYINNSNLKDFENFIDLHSNSEIIPFTEFMKEIRKHPKIYLNLEIKDPNFEILDLLERDLILYEMPNEIRISSFTILFKNQLLLNNDKYIKLKDVSFGFLFCSPNDLERFLEDDSKSLY